MVEAAIVERSARSTIADIGPHCPASIMRQALDLASDLTFFVSPNTRSVHAPADLETLRLFDVNRAACAALAYSKRALLAKQLAKIVSPKSQQPFTERVGMAYRQPEVAVDGKIHLLARDGRTVIVEAMLQYLHDSREPLFVVVGRDVTNRRRRERIVSSPSDVDPLTGLPNRAVLEGRLQSTLARAKKEGRRFAVLLIDVDRFKWINDGYGHLAGDAVLKTVARRLAGCLRADDLVVRYGGDEFLVIIDGLADQSEAHGLADRILSAVRAPLIVEGAELRVSVSVGITIADGLAQSFHTLIGQADRGMYRAKALGRDRRYTTPASPNAISVQM
jgi:diguanylate cyclase (GGDEF)-like protein/PAS domain S-box-containing protein